jgi:hypothetical protein
MPSAGVEDGVLRELLNEAHQMIMKGEDPSNVKKMGSGAWNEGTPWLESVGGTPHDRMIEGIKRFLEDRYEYGGSAESGLVVTPYLWRIDEGVPHPGSSRREAMGGYWESSMAKR